MVVPAAKDIEVRLVRGAALFPRLSMIDFAAAGFAVAVGESAGPIPDDHMIGQVLRRAVGASAVVEQTSHFVGDEAAPGAGLIGGDLAGE
jgi:hypothetical protein